MKAQISQMAAGPFLISKNLYLDYRTVAAPDFIIAKNWAGLLSKAAIHDFSGPVYEKLYCRKVHVSKSENLVLIYRIIKVKKHHIGYADGELLRDSVGRPIFWIEGIAFHGLCPNADLCAFMLDELSGLFVRCYQQFWFGDKKANLYCLNSLEWQWSSCIEVPKKFIELEPLIIRRCTGLRKWFLCCQNSFRK